MWEGLCAPTVFLPIDECRGAKAPPTLKSVDRMDDVGAGLFVVLELE